MKTKQKTTAEIMREEAIRLGMRPIIIDGEPVKPAKLERRDRHGGNGSKK